MHDLLAFARQTLAAQPFSRLLQAQVDVATREGAVLSVLLREELMQQNGFAHGGVVSYLADNALTFAGGLALAGPVLTGEFKINYVRPAIGDVLVARASAIHAGRTQAVCQAEIFARKGDEEKLVAVAQGTIVRIEA